MAGWAACRHTLYERLLEEGEGRALDPHRGVSPSLAETVSKGLMQGARDDLVSHLKAVAAPA